MLRAIILAVLVLLATAPRPAAAQTAPLSPAQAQAALSVLQDPQKRDALIATLQSLAGSPAAAATAKPAAAPAAAPAAQVPVAKPDVPLAPGSLGAVVLDTSTRVAGELTSQAVAAAQSITDFPLLWRWASHVAGDPAERDALLAAVWRLAAVGAIAIAVERLVGLGLVRIRRGLREHAPAAPMEPVPDEPAPSDGLALAEAGGLEPTPRQSHARMRRAVTLLRRLPFAFGLLLLDLLPIGAFVVVANAAAASDLGGGHDSHDAIVVAIFAYAICRLVLVAAGFVLSPRAANLRLVVLADPTADLVMGTITQIAVISGVGYALAEILLVFGLYRPAHDALLRLTGLAMHLCLVALVIRCRRPVADWLAGHPDLPADGARISRRRSSLSLLRHRVAEIWHWVAVVMILGIWLVYAFEIHHGVRALLNFVIITIVVLGVSRLLAILLQGGLARLLRVDAGTAARFPSLPDRAARYAPAMRAVLNLLIAAATLVVLLEAWGIDSLTWFTPGALGGRVFFSALRLVFAFAIAAILWEGVNASMQAHLIRLSDEGLAVRAVRLRTLLPMLRTTLFVTLAIVVSLMTLSEIGINIAPLLAGAGIIGVAVGFGSQKLVQDLITGIFLLLENTMQVGDAVTLGGLSGVVEYLSIRTIRLRAGDGSVHIIPFSSVTTVTNTNRGQGNAPVSIALAYDEDTDEVSAMLVDIAAAMQAEDAFKHAMTGPLQLWGVDQVSATSVTIAGQIPCTDAGRWGVQREFNRRVKQRFQAAGIQLATPTQVLVLRHPLDVRMEQLAQPPKQTRTGAAA